MSTCSARGRVLFATGLATTLAACQPPSTRPAQVPIQASPYPGEEACLCDPDKVEPEAEQWFPDDAPARKKGVRYVKLNEWR